MSFIWAFVAGGIVCALFEAVNQLVKIKPPHLLLIGVVIGGLMGATGIVAAVLAFGGAGFGIMVTGFGNGVYQAAAAAFAGDPLPAVLAFLEVAILTCIGILASRLHARK